MYIIELTLKFSPYPLTVQKKAGRDAESLYRHLKTCMDKQHPKLLELTCDQIEDKKITLLLDHLMAIQIYEKTSATGGNKRPGFAFD